MILTQKLVFMLIILTAVAQGTKRDHQQQQQQSKIWNFKFAFTTTLNSQLSIDCPNEDQIWIGWSHYGTRGSSNELKSSASNRHSSSYMMNEAAIASSSIRNSQLNL